MVNLRIERARAYTDALEHAEVMFNRLYHDKKLTEQCKDCPLLTEIEKLRIAMKDDVFRIIETEQAIP